MRSSILIIYIRSIHYEDKFTFLIFICLLNMNFMLFLKLLRLNDMYDVSLKREGVNKVRYISLSIIKLYTKISKKTFIRTYKK